MSTNEIDRALFACQGIAAHRELAEDEKEIVRRMEQPENRGVSEALSRKGTLVAVHDATFRKPPAPTVLLEHEGRITGRENVLTGEFEFEGGREGRYVFPPVPFPELDSVALKAVSSSPSRAVHLYLMALLGIEDNPEFATLLIGFDRNE